jgi:hypothetical protein
MKRVNVSSNSKGKSINHDIHDDSELVMDLFRNKFWGQIAIKHGG